ncbi:dihydrolipoamide acetyltransferase family protein [Nocardia gipuzkoensis]
MSDSQQFKLPDVGEGLTEAEITSWHVEVGDTVDVNDPLVEIETAKSAVELPSPYAGIVEKILVQEGDNVPVGTPIIVIGSGIAAARPAPAETSAPSRDVEEPVANADLVEEDKPQVLVGPGPKDAAQRRRRLGTPRRVDSAPANTSPENSARAAPPVRLAAKQMGVDLERLARVVDGVISLEDVARAATSEGRNGQVAAGSARAAVDPPGRETRTPVKGVRKLTAEAMSRSAFTAPHVTEWVTIDVTPTMELLGRLKKDRAWEGVRINPLVLVARAFLLAIRAHPGINASWDETNQEIVLKHYVNLGIAAATPRGLIVPNIKDAHTLDTRQLASALADLVTLARSGKTPPADMAQGTVTITNIGALGVDAGTPILNPGESAILAFGAIRDQPWVVDGRIEIRKVTQLAMSFDHRLVDGELGSNVLARTGAILADPSTALLYA